MSDETIEVITMRVVDSEPVPEEYGETHVMTCDECGEEVYVTSTTFEAINERGSTNVSVICNVCILPRVVRELNREDDDPDLQEIVAADPAFQPIIDNRRREFLLYMLSRGLPGRGDH